VPRAGCSAIRRRLAIEGYLPRTAAAGNVYDKQVARAVAAFQENYGLSVTGRVDAATAKAMSVPVDARIQTMRANLLRIPEYSKQLQRRYVTVNIPAAKLEAVDGGRVVTSHAVIVGKPERPSPVVSSEVSEINFNPYWHAPKSIVAKDIVPEVRKHGIRKLKELQIIVLDGGYQGPEIDPRQIDWKAPAEEIAERYHFRQEPGGINAMASVKINFRNKYAVYMHDTPTKQLFNSNQRYFSSGCVRVEDVHS
jgi:murein L,D-transpeptidase YcbB/YkuD